MPSPSDPIYNSMSAEESVFELLADTLENVDRTARGQFLQRFFKTIAQLDLTEVMSLGYWDQIELRRRELAESLGRPISLKTAMIDVLASSSHLRVPVLMEYEDLKKLQINAATDPLTGLYNRRLFEEQFEKELNRAMRYSHRLALVILDLHKFKEVNDRFGHPRGDLMLQTAAGTLRKSLRTSDYAFRIGGDEFALLLVQSDKEQSLGLARRIRANFLAATEPALVNVGLGLDFGVGVFPDDGDNRETLVRLADERLYEMKQMNHAASAQQQFRTSRRQAAPFSPTAPGPSAAPSSGQRGAAARAPIPYIPEAKPPVAPPIARAIAGAVAPQPEPPVYSQPERRKHERVTLSGTRAYAQMGDDPNKLARVLDLGYGGVALEMSPMEQLGGIFFAVLHVPILPPVRVSLKQLYETPSASGQSRIGCTFIT